MRGWYSRRSVRAIRRAGLARQSAESLELRCLLATLTVSNTDESGAGSLRQAILSANSQSGQDTIIFDIPATDPGHVYYQDDGVAGQVTETQVVQTTAADDGAIADIDPDWPHSWFSIRPDTTLPSVGASTIIDGYSQSHAQENTAADAFNGILRIELDGSNMTNGLRLNGSNSEVSGLVINRVASFYPIYVYTAHNSKINGNLIGTDVSGTLPMGRNGQNHGILSSATDVVIGGTLPALKNVVSGNAGVGVWLDTNSQRNTIQGNLIGTAADGVSPMGNAPPGSLLGGIQINFSSNDHVIGGAAEGAGNVIAFNNGIGVSNGDRNSRNTLIEGNHIHSNSRSGIIAAAENTQIFDNLVEANLEYGLGVSGDGQRVEGNTVVNNALSGLRIGGGPVAVLGNSVHSNGLLGINLVGGTEDAFFVTANDALDADAGPNNNNLQNYPVITSATTAGPSTTIAGTLHSEPDTAYRLEFFDNETTDESGHGEGERYLGFAEVTTDSEGNVMFSETVPTGSDLSRSITATATRLFDHDSDPQTPLVPWETSEFAAAWEVELGDIATFVNDNWHLVSDADNSGDLTFGDQIRNDNDTADPGSVTATYGKDGFGAITTGAFTGALPGFDEINDAIALTQDGGTTTLLGGTYFENVRMDRNLTLTGGTGTAEDVVISPGSGDGIVLLDGPDSVTIKNLMVTTAAHGIAADVLISMINLENVVSMNNAGTGFALAGVGDVVAMDLVAAGNAAGAVITAASFTDSNGSYSNNSDHGIRLIDIAGNVTLNGTTVEDNDANADTAGDGLRITDGPDSDSLAIGGTLSIEASTIRATSNQNGLASQRRGVSVDGGIGAGISLSGGVTLSGHADHGFATSGAIPLAGDVTFTDVAASDNGGAGIVVAQEVSGRVDLANVIAERNSKGGIAFSGGVTGHVTLNDVQAGNNGDDGFFGRPGIFVDGAASFSDTNGVYRNNARDGIYLHEIAGDVTLTGTTLEDNDGDNDGEGNGLHVIDLGLNSLAIGGALTIRGATIRDTDGEGDVSQQHRGVFVTGVGQHVTIEGLYDADGDLLQRTDVTGHVDGGVLIAKSNTDNTPLGGDVVLRDVTASENRFNSGILFEQEVHGDVELTNVIARSNGDSGVAVTAGGTGHVTAQNVQTDDNAFAGISLPAGAESFTDRGGQHQRNHMHGIHLIDIAGDVTLEGTTLEDNSSAGLTAGQVFNTHAVGGSLIISGATIRDTGDEDHHQQRGIHIKGGVTDSASLDGLVNTDGSLSRTELTGHEHGGLLIADFGGTPPLQGDVSIRHTTARDTSEGPGISFKQGVLGHVEMVDVVADGNFDSGVVFFAGVQGDVALTDVRAAGNGIGGVRFIAVGSFSDTDGVYRNNGDHGIILSDVTGDVTLTGTVLEDNDANGNGYGDGLSVTTSVSSEQPAIGGSLTIRGATVQDTDAQGTLVRQQRGVYVYRGAAGTVTVEGLIDAEGNIQPTVMTGHDQEGLLIEAGQLSALFNTSPLSDSVTLRNVVVSGNGETGIQFGPNFSATPVPLIDGSVTLTDVVAEENGGYGIRLDERSGSGGGLVSGDSVLTDVQASGNAESGIRIASGGSFSETGGVYEFNARHGLEIDILGDIVFSGSAFDGNGTSGSGSGVNVSRVGVGGGSPSITFTDISAGSNSDAGLSLSGGLSDLTLEDGTLAKNGGSGIRVHDGIGSAQFTAVDTSENGEHGIQLWHVGGDVMLAHVQATNNAAAGVFVKAAASLSDADGVYVGNNDHGIAIGRVYGNLTLTGSTLEDNDADADDSGDGLNVADEDNSDDALGGFLLIEAATIRDSDGTGGASHQVGTVFVDGIERGVTVVDSVIGSLDLSTVTTLGGDLIIRDNTLAELQLPLAGVVLGNLEISGNANPRIHLSSRSLTVTGGASFADADVTLTAAALNVSEILTLGAASTLVVDSTSNVSAAGMVFLEGSEVSGDGTLAANAVDVAGTLAPGASPGELTVEGNLTLAAGSTLKVEIAGRSPGQHDIVSATGAVAVDGSAEFTFANGFSPEAGERVTFLVAQSVAGEFSSISFAGLPDGLVAGIERSGQDLVLVVNSDGPDPDTACLDQPVGISLDGSTLYVVGSSKGDNLRVRKGRGRRIQARAGSDRRSFHSNRVRFIVICGHDGRDTLRVDDGIEVPAILDGGDGGDTITGGPGADTISGRGGNDFLEGGGGNDSITGGGGDDWIYGEQGDDFIQAGSGRDRAYGGDDRDTILGSGGPDRLYGGRGSDLLLGGPGLDRLYGQNDRDLLIGGTGGDVLDGGSHSDLLLAGTTVFGSDALAAVLDEWASQRSYDRRIANVRGHDAEHDRHNGEVYLTAAGGEHTTTVADDRTPDTLSGKGGRDWVFASLADRVDSMGATEVLDLL